MENTNLNTTPADEIASTTTGEPVTEQAPTESPEIASSTNALPAGYLSNGYYATTDKGAKYFRSEYVGKYAEQLADSFSSEMKVSDFAALFRELKRSKKRTLPYEARLTAISEMRPKVLSLVHRKKAPALLADFVKANLSAVQDDDDAAAFLRHCEAIHAYMTSFGGGV